MSRQSDIIQKNAEAEAPQALVVPSGMMNLVEALVFAATEPLSIRQLKAIYEFSAPPGSGEERHIEADEIRAIIADLNAEYKRSNRPYRIIRIAGGYQFATLRDYAGWLGKLRREQSRKKLSQSSIESLAIVAYRQPITKSDVEAIRGVNCDYVMKTLLEKELVRVTGRAETVGRPLLYGTSREFLVHFGLNEITDLPRPREIEEILGETQFETERRMLEAQEAAEKMKEEEDFKSRLPHIPKRRSGLGENAVEVFPRKRPSTLDIHDSDQLSIESRSDDKAEIPEKQEKQEQSPDMRRSVPASPVVPRSVVPSDIPDGTTGAADRSSPDASSPVQQPQKVPTSRWRSWKEKIQGFIRKIFD